MNYLPIDFDVLGILDKSELHTVDTLWTELSHMLCTPIGLPCISSVLAALSEGGYITVAHTILTPDTSVKLTDRGRAAVTIGGMSKLFASARIKAMRRNMHSFCTRPRPSTAPMAWDASAFAEQVREDNPSSHIPMLFGIKDGENGSYTVTFSYDAYSEEDIPMEAVSLVCDRETLDRMLEDLLDTALLLSESDQIRKIPLFGVGRAYIMTFAVVADETGEYEATRRMTIAPILFNRQRFYGKRDSQLDYAQCGDNALVRTDAIGASDIYCAALLRPDLLEAHLGDKMDALYPKVQL